MTKQFNKPIRILLVEDHPIYREGLQLALSFSGIDCIVVASTANVQEAVSFIESHPEGIDLVMLDFFLPDGNGNDVIEALKKHGSNVKVLVVTSATDAPEVVRLAGQGIHGVIGKEVESSDLGNIKARNKSPMSYVSACEPLKGIGKTSIVSSTSIPSPT